MPPDTQSRLERQLLNYYRIVLHGIVLLAAIGIALYSFDYIYGYNANLAALPDSIKFSKILTLSRSISCTAVTHEREPDFAKRLRVQDITYLGHDTKQRSGDNNRNLASAWKATLVPEAKTHRHFSKWAVRRRNENKYDYGLANRIEKWSKAPDEYNIATDNREDMIHVFATHLRAYHLESDM